MAFLMIHLRSTGSVRSASGRTEGEKRARKIPGPEALRGGQRPVVDEPQARASHDRDNRAKHDMRGHCRTQAGKADDPWGKCGPDAERDIGPFLSFVERVERSPRDQRYAATHDPGVPC